MNKINNGWRIDGWRINRLMPIYLLLKQHMDTKLQYLHKTTTNKLYRVLNYKGSGIYWKKHLNKHGNNIRSVILEIANTPAEFLEKVAKYNEKWQIGKNRSFANLIPETGDRWYTTNDNTSDGIDNYSTKLSNNRYKFNATPAGKENLRRIGDKKRAKAQTPEGKLFYKQLGVMCSKSQKGKTMKERLNNPTYIDPRKNKKFCEIYKEGMSHAQQRPFKYVIHLQKKSGYVIMRENLKNS